MDAQTERGFERYGTYQPERTGILLVDPYNDFLHPDGKAYPLSKQVIEEMQVIDNMLQVINRARDLKMKVFIVPHHRVEPEDYKTWKYPTPVQLATQKLLMFGKGTWGGEFHDDFKPQPGDTVIKEHWSQNGFTNTDLDFQLKQQNIDKVILIGMLANTCIEATGRYAMELGYHVTLVKNASAAFTKEHMHAAHELNGPTYAHAILTTEELATIFEKIPTPHRS